MNYSTSTTEKTQPSCEGKQSYENRDSIWQLLTRTIETLRPLDQTSGAILSRTPVHLTSHFFLHCRQLLWAPPGGALSLNMHDLPGVTFAMPGCVVPAGRMLADKRTAAQREDLVIGVTHFGGGWFERADVQYWVEVQCRDEKGERLNVADC